MGNDTTLDCFDQLRTDIRKIVQRWNNRLIPWKFNFAEEYINSRLYIACDFPCKAHKIRVVLRNYGDILNAAPILIRDVKHPTAELGKRNDQPVLIDIVQAVKQQKRTIPSAAIYLIQNDGTQFFSDLRSKGNANWGFSILHGSFCVEPIRMDWELYSSRIDAGIKAADDGEYGVIKRRPEVMDGISNSEVNVIWDRLRRLKAKFRIPIFEIGGNFVSFSRGEFSDESLGLSDVFLGPTDL